MSLMRLCGQLRRYNDLVQSHPLARQEPLAAWARFVWWQVRARLTGLPMTVEYVNGTRFKVIRGRPASTAVWYVGLAEFDEMMFVLHVLRRGDVFVDGGANVGVWSILAASTGAEVIAVEPVAETHRLLASEVELNQLEKLVHCRRCALVSKSREVFVTSDRDAGNSVVAENTDTRTESVSGQTLDEVCGDKQPTLIKLDLEGGELEALYGADRVLSDPRLLGLVIETFRPHSWKTVNLQAIEQLLAKHGFFPHQYDAAARNLIALTDPADGVQNTIYVRDADAVGILVKSGPAVKLPGRRV